MPRQRPGRSRQDYGTPPELIRTVKDRLKIDDFWVDLAASADNKVCDYYYDEAQDSLAQSWLFEGSWGWCNPPFGHIEPWVYKAAMESSLGASVVMLVPSSVGSNWWRDWVAPWAYITHLNGRVTFVGETDPYIKDCSLLLYTPWRMVGSETWSWNR